MKAINLLSILILVTGMNFSCSAQTNKQQEGNQIAKADKIEVYYFHYTRRCATCNAVESVSKEAVTELYGDKVNFYEFNLDEPEGKKKGEELEVSGQTLLIVADETKINLTNEGFMNARNNPEKLKQVIKENIDPLL